MNNALFEIYPYKSEFGSWVFDDARVGLVREPFVAGIDDMIEFLTAKIPHAANGFILRFSPRPFPGRQLALRWVREEHGGNWYACDELGKEGWLCPALFRYFDVAPREISFQVLTKSAP